VERVQALIGAPADDVRLGPAASESAVNALSAVGALQQYRVLHLAAHGRLGPGAGGGRPSLVLTLQGDLQGEDGLLDLDEIMGLHLNADLVVLSACESGRSGSRESGGVGSLARAFLFAGSAGVVGSLWRVDDRATAELMVAFYENRKAGHRAAQALRAAKIRMIGADEPPRHWAPFVLIGQ
jgi:CHAT domain-containing protein